MVAALQPLAEPLSYLALLSPAPLLPPLWASSAGGGAGAAAQQQVPVELCTATMALLQLLLGLGLTAAVQAAGEARRWECYAARRRAEQPGWAPETVSDRLYSRLAGALEAGVRWELMALFVVAAWHGAVLLS